MNHCCHARGCVVQVPPEMLMCRAHWYKVPKVIRDAVWHHYRAGQCDDKNPSEGWHEAADAAIGHIAKMEGRPLSKSEQAALEKFQAIRSVVR